MSRPLENRLGGFYCIEGGDGSGKKTQLNMLVERLRQSDVQILRLEYPRYHRPLGQIINLYLTGGLDDKAANIGPKVASALYAADRAEQGGEIRDALTHGAFVMTDRFSASNMAHQGAKLEPGEREDFFRWNHWLEHTELGSPFPDHHFLLHLPAHVANERMVRRAEETGQAMDQHEADLDHQIRTEATYLQLAAFYPDNFSVIACMDGGRPKTPDEIHEDVWQTFQEVRA